MPGRAISTVAEINQVDHAVYEAIARSPTPSLDRELATLSRIADHSKLWLACAGLMAWRGGPPGRRAAVRGLTAIAVASGGVNLGVKLLSRRGRPDRAGAAVPEARHVRMPISSSFPSGHAASAFAFATAAGHANLAFDVPLRVLATLVAYSRIHTGVHYPGDVLVGALIGGVAGNAVAAIRR
ncbi:MAG TPA: phosphatase PAP2 family protein [Solirubrobacteraceae bacterium]|nr:phosphatase PAP2 family protein [Solirubrobacteraceae bacterium]